MTKSLNHDSEDDWSSGPLMKCAAAVGRPVQYYC